MPAAVLVTFLFEGGGGSMIKLGLSCFPPIFSLILYTCEIIWKQSHKNFYVKI